MWYCSLFSSLSLLILVLGLNNVNNCSNLIHYWLLNDRGHLIDRTWTWIREYIIQYERVITHVFTNITERPLIGHYT